MPPPEPGPTFSDEVLETAALVLGKEGFAIEAASLPGSEVEFLWAENEYFILAVFAAATFDGLDSLESDACSAVLDRLGSSDLGAKAWDVYLVLMLSSRVGDTEEETREVFEILHDTRFLRRILHVGVEPTDSSVREALAPFLPLISLRQEDVLQDALAELEGELPSHGIEPDTASRVVTAYRETGSLRNV